MLLRAVRGIILEQQLWWADLHLGKRDLPPQRSLDKTSISLMLQGCGKARPPLEELLEAHCPGNWDKTARPFGAQLKENSHPRLVAEASFLPRGMPVCRVPELKLAARARGYGELMDLF